MKYFKNLDILDAKKIEDILKPHKEIGTFCIENMRIIRSDAFEKIEEYTNSYVGGVRMKYMIH